MIWFIGDAGENNAIRTLLGSHARNVQVSSTKGKIFGSPQYFSVAYVYVCLSSKSPKTVGIFFWNYFGYSSTRNINYRFVE